MVHLHTLSLNLESGGGMWHPGGIILTRKMPYMSTEMSRPQAAMLARNCAFHVFHQLRLMKNHPEGEREKCYLRLLGESQLKCWSCAHQLFPQLRIWGRLHCLLRELRESLSSDMKGLAFFLKMSRKKNLKKSLHTLIENLKNKRANTAARRFKRITSLVKMCYWGIPEETSRICFKIFIRIEEDITSVLMDLKVIGEIRLMKIEIEMMDRSKDGKETEKSKSRIWNFTASIKSMMELTNLKLHQINRKRTNFCKRWNVRYGQWINQQHMHN